jgi:solute carrier family 25 phosphate transporter 3
VNERCTEFIYNRMSLEQRENLSSTQQLGITLSSGIVAGFAAAVLSHVCYRIHTLPCFSLRAVADD